MTNRESLNVPVVNLAKKRIAIYLAIVYFLVFGSGLLAITIPGPIGSTAYTILFALFSLFPFVANIATRIITRDKSPWLLRLNIKGNFGKYIAAALFPGVLIFLGAVVYFLIFPSQLDLSAQQLVLAYGPFGFPSDLPHTLGSIIKIGIVGIFISPLIVPVVVFAFGEEIGWRGYLLPNLLQCFSVKKAVLLNGLLWGINHIPLIYFGLNYGETYLGAPWTGMILMILVCVVLGVWLSFYTIKTKSVFPASIMHGAANVIGEWPAFVALPGIYPLLGPNPTGLIGMSFLLMGSVVCFWLLSTSKSED